MVSAFTHYWTTDTWEQYRGISGSGSPLCHTSSELFGTRGLRNGDLLYVVTVLNNDILLIGKMRIARVCDHHEAAAMLGKRPDQLSPDETHAVAAECTPISFSTVILPGTVRELRFYGAEGERGLNYQGVGLHPQALRGVNRLTHPSAAQLDSILPPLANFTPVNHRPFRAVCSSTDRE